MKKALGFAWEVALETLWPTRCAVCDIPGEKVLCELCESRLMPVDECMACPRCGAPHGLLQCTECNDVSLASSGFERFEELPIDGMAHALLLDEAARRVVTVYKDGGERRLCGVIAGWLARYVPPDLARQGFVMTYIPDTAAALRRRGFDHSEEIARELSARCGIRCMQLLERPASADQRTLGRQQRVENMRGIMSACDNVEMPRKVLVVDDVCTTGATLYSAAFALKDAGAEVVRCLTFGKVVD